MPKAETELHGNFSVLHADICDAKTFNPFSHVYMYDIGFPTELHIEIAKRFNASLYADYLISFYPERNVVDDCGFDVEFIHKVEGLPMSGK